MIKRILAAAMVLAALLLLFTDWVTYESINAPLEMALGEVEESIAKGEGAEFVAPGAEKLIAQLETGISPYDISALAGLVARQAFGMPELTDEFLALGIVCLLIQLLFWLGVALLLALMAQHLFGRKQRGIGATLLVLLLYFAPICAFAGFVRANREMWPTQPILTPAAFVAVALMVASCVVWHIYLKTDGAQSGKWRLRPQRQCPNCGTVQEFDGRIFCSSCGKAMDGG